MIVQKFSPWVLEFWSKAGKHNIGRFLLILFAKDSKWTLGKSDVGWFCIQFLSQLLDIGSCVDIVENSMRNMKIHWPNSMGGMALKYNVTLLDSQMLQQDGQHDNHQTLFQRIVCLYCIYYIYYPSSQNHWSEKHKEGIVFVVPIFYWTKSSEAPVIVQVTSNSCLTSAVLDGHWFLGASVETWLLLLLNRNFQVSISWIHWMLNSYEIKTWVSRLMHFHLVSKLEYLQHKSTT